MYPVRTHYEFAGEGFRGSELFRHNNCTNCHKAVGNGTNMGLNLDGIGTRHDLAYIQRFLHDPEATYVARTVDHGPAPKEAAYVARIPEADLQSIAVFLSQLKVDRGAPAAAAPPGESGFIDAMLDMWVPDGWRVQFSDVRKDEVKSGEPSGDKPSEKPNEKSSEHLGEGEHGSGH
jgi:cytochrome c553